MADKIKAITLLDGTKIRIGYSVFIDGPANIEREYLVTEIRDYSTLQYGYYEIYGNRSEENIHMLMQIFPDAVTIVYYV